MVTLIWLVIILALAAVFAKFFPLTALWLLVLGGLYLAGVIPASDGFFTTFAYGIPACMAFDSVCIVARAAGFGNGRVRIGR